MCYDCAMERGSDFRKWWAPRAGDIVKPTNSTDLDLHRMALRRADVRPLERDRLYEVIEYIQDEDRRALRLREVSVVNVAGVQHVTRGKELTYTPPIDLLEPVRKFAGKKAAD